MANLPATDLKARVDLRNIVSMFWGQPKRQRPRYDVYKSRWRDDGRNASFTVYSTHFKDYGGDGTSGDVFTFLESELNLSFVESLEWLQTHLGGAVAEITPRPALSESSHEPPTSDWQHAAADALQTTQDYLWSNRRDAQRALHYLRHVRGLTDNTIKRAGYGYNPRWSPVRWKHPETGKRVRLAPGIIEPWWCDGVLWALRVRCRVGNLAEALGVREDRVHGEISPKYLNLTGSKQSGAMYNGDSITDGCDVLVVEGGFDARLAEQHLQQHDNTISVVTFGSATNHPPQRRIEQLKSANRVFLLLDSDEAGQSAQAKLQAALGDKAEIITLPQGKDITDYVINHGGDMGMLLSQISPSLSTERGLGGEVWWGEGVPDGVRSALLKYFRPVTAPVIEMINTAFNQGLVNPQAFTIADVLAANEELGFNISVGSVRRVINELETYFFAKLDTNKNNILSVPNFENNSRGRRASFYCALDLSTVEQSIIDWATPRIIEKIHPNLPNEHAALADPTPEMFTALAITEHEANEIVAELKSRYENVYLSSHRTRQVAREISDLRRSLGGNRSTPLPEGWVLSTGGEFRAAFLRATNDENIRRSRREIRELVGCSNGSVDNVVKQAGLQRKVEGGEFKEVTIEHSDDLEQQVKQGARRVMGYPRAVVVDHGDAREVQAYRGEDSAEYIQEQIGMGAQVSIRYQVANHYVELDEIPQDAPKVTPQPRREQTVSSRRRNRQVYGPHHDPIWVLEQFIQLLVKTGKVRQLGGCALLEVATGEVHPLPGLRLMLEISRRGGDRSAS